MSYFGTTKRGEIPELQEELNSLKPERKKEAVKKVIAAMTVGKDVSPLFPHVVKCMETTNIELKKLVYLYIINYAKTQPDAAILAVNTFRKDAVQRVNPLIRALAVRTMGCLRVSQIAEYLCDPLRAALQDDDPYVRKTAAICVSKLYDITPELVEDNGFLEILINLLSDGNSMVVANSVCALCEISEIKRQPISFVTLPICSKLLTALNECTEWGQVYILDCLAQFTPPDSGESERILERVTPRLSHANPAVVLSAVRVCMKYMDFITSAETIRTLCRKLTPPLVTLLASDAEIQFIALRNINLIIQKRPNILERDIKVFFCKYNDPIYVKLEKLEIMIKLSDLKNIDQVLHEFKEYATEIDVEFVRKSVRAIGRCAIKLEKAAERCIQCLLDLVQLKVNYVVQEAIVVIRDIFRKYPNRYELIIKDLFDNLTNLDEPEAKASMIWIIGENAEKIEDATAQLTTFINGFKDEPTHVQLQILTATVKLFLKKPEESEDLITRILKLSTEDSDNPDLRDRGYIYWRLLSTDPEAAKAIVLSDKPTISEESYTLENSLLDKLLEGLGTLASVYHKPPESFQARDTNRTAQPPEEQLEQQDIQGQDYSEQMKEAEAIDNTAQNKAQNEQGEGFNSGQVDLLGMEESEVKQPQQNKKPSELDQLEQMFISSTPQSSGKIAKIPLQAVLQATQGGQNGKSGVQIEAAFQKGPFFEIKITNQSQESISNFQIQFNVNAFCLAVNPQLPIDSILPGQQITKQIQVNFSGNLDNNPPVTPFVVQMAVRCSLDTFYFQTPCMFSILLQDTIFSAEEFKSKWPLIQNELVHQIKIHADYQDLEAKKARLSSNGVQFVMDNQGVQYYTGITVNKYRVFAEVQLNGQIKVKSEQRPLVPLFAQALNFLLGTNF